MVYIANHTDINLQITRKKRTKIAKIANTHQTKIFIASFALAEMLPTFTTLISDQTDHVITQKLISRSEKTFCPIRYKKISSYAHMSNVLLLWCRYPLPLNGDRIHNLARWILQGRMSEILFLPFFFDLHICNCNCNTDHQIWIVETKPALSLSFYVWGMSMSNTRKNCRFKGIFRRAAFLHYVNFLQHGG